MTTAEAICQSVPNWCLNLTVSDEHIAEIAKNMTKWQELAPFLNLTKAEEEDIVEQYQCDLPLQKREALQKWKEKNRSGATYRRLIVTFCSQGRADLAEKVKDFLLTSEREFPSACAIPSTQTVTDMFHDHLCKWYSSLPHPSVLQWPDSSTECYIELELLESPLKGDREEKSDKYKCISLESVFTIGNPKAKRKIILIEGVAGAGKTTLSWYACKEWAAGRLFRKFNVKLLILVPLCDLTLHSSSKLADLIPHPDKKMRAKVANAIANNLGQGVCFLLEGCDEAPPSLWKSFLYRFVAGSGSRSMVPNAHFILLSRPSASIQLTNNLSLTGKVLIKGFQSLDQFFAACSVDNKDQLIEAVEMKPELYSLCHLPLNAVILVYLYDTLKDNLPTTRTGLFDPLVRNFLYRHMQTRTIYNPSSIDNLPEDLPADIRKSLSKVSELAYKSILERKKIVDRRTLTEFGFNDIDNTLGFLRVHFRLSMYGMPSECYSFVHLSLQEYLAALYIKQMKDLHQQAAAVREVFEQNPLSPVLTFYAGLTRLTNKQARDVFFDVLNSPLDMGSIAMILGLNKLDTFFGATPAHDPRRQVLALINCIYETQDLSLIAYVKLPARDIGDLLVRQSSVKLVSSEGVTRDKHDYITFRGLFLYPTDCLSIGYFARYAGSKTTHRLHLEFAHCPLGDMEIKALAQELKKPAARDNVELSLGNVRISANALTSLSAVFHPHSCLVGLTVTGYLLKDIQLAMKYFIEGFCKSKCQTLILYYACGHKIVHHLVLLLRCPKLKNLNLCYTNDLFANSTVARLLSESLKFTRLVRLCLDDCGINDDALLLLAPGVCHKHCTVCIFETDKNPYSVEALARFLQYMLKNEPNNGKLTVLSVTHKRDIHERLVKEINWYRFLYRRPSLTLRCASELKDEHIQAQLQGMHLLDLRPDLGFRSPHH